MSWVDETYEAVRKHPLSEENRWLIQTSAALCVELTGALKRERELRQEIALLRER